MRHVCLVCKVKNAGRYIFKHLVGQHVSTHMYTHTHLYLGTQHVFIGMHTHTHTRTHLALRTRYFPWSCDQYFATQIFKGPREAYYLKEIYYDFHKPIYLLIQIITPKLSKFGFMYSEIACKTKHRDHKLNYPGMCSFVTFHLMGKQVTITSNVDIWNSRYQLDLVQTRKTAQRFLYEQKQENLVCANCHTHKISKGGAPCIIVILPTQRFTKINKPHLSTGIGKCLFVPY